METVFNFSSIFFHVLLLSCSSNNFESSLSLVFTFCHRERPQRREFHIVPFRRHFDKKLRKSPTISGSGREDMQVGRYISAHNSWTTFLPVVLLRLPKISAVSLAGLMRTMKNSCHNFEFPPRYRRVDDSRLHRGLMLIAPPEWVDSGDSLAVWPVDATSSDVPLSRGRWMDGRGWGCKREHFAGFRELDENAVSASVRSQNRLDFRIMHQNFLIGFSLIPSPIFFCIFLLSDSFPSLGEARCRSRRTRDWILEISLPSSASMVTRWLPKMWLDLEGGERRRKLNFEAHSFSRFAS